MVSKKPVIESSTIDKALASNLEWGIIIGFVAGVLIGKFLL